MKKVRPTLCHSTLRSILTSDKFVFTHGFINVALSTAQLLSHLSETIPKQQGLMRVTWVKARDKRYCKQQGFNTSSILSWRKRVNHTAINSIGLSLTDYL